MNNRFEELFRQVREEVNSSHGLSDAFNGIVMEKFAELLIQECAKVIDNSPGSLDDYAMVYLGEHFGIGQ